MNTITRSTIAAAVGALLIGASACSGGSDPASTGTTRPDKTTTTTAAEPLIDPGDGGRYRPAIEPSRFVKGIDNPYLPLKPGARWVYEGRSDGATERIEVVVTDETKTIEGIEAVVVRDTVTRDGVLFEDTTDWYAQDVDGNVWYLGEATEEHEDGKVSTAGSWETGVKGAQPGIAMPARPKVGRAYRQEFAKGEAEDVAKVLRLGRTADVPAGSYRDVVVIEEWNPFDPKVLEEKSFAPGVGLVLEVQTAGGKGRNQLVEFTPGA